MTDTQPQYEARMAEARESYTCGDPGEQARWDAMPYAEQAHWKLAHERLAHAQLRHCREALTQLVERHLIPLLTRTTRRFNR